MASERFSLTVLPLSTDPARPFHVSLHIAPRLDGGGKLGDYPLFSNFGAALAGAAAIRLLDQAGAEIASTPRLDRIAPDLWPFVFPPELAVEAQSFDTFAGRRWRTFSAKGVHDAAMMTHLVAFLASPSEPPLPSAFPLTRAIAEFAHVPMEPSPRRIPYDERRITAELDERIAGIDEKRRDGLAVGAGGSPVLDMAVALHQARRFYERPEAAEEYKDRPVAGAVSPPLPRPPTDFHREVAHLSDQPELLRRLGLVLDLEVTDLDGLSAASELRAEIELPDFPGVAESLRTPVRRVGTDLLTVPATDAFQDGALRLGDTERYSVLVLDADGSALKLDRFLWTLPRLLSVEFNGDPAHAAPPAIRVGGLTVVENGNLAGLRDQLDRTAANLSARGAGGPIRLATEDVTRGFRVEAWDSFAGKWFSLHERLVDTEVADYGDVFSGVSVPGFIQGTGATETPGIANGPLHVHDALFGWSGWSLAAPRPGPRVRHEAGKEVVEPTAPDPDPVTRARRSVRVAPGTLPRLRYGRSYAFRAWTVDLAGNSPPHAPPPGTSEDPFDLPPASPAGPDGGPSAIEPSRRTAAGASRVSDDLRGHAAALVARSPIRRALPGAALSALKTEARRRFAEERRPDVLAGRVEPDPEMKVTGVEAVDSLVRTRLAEMRRPDILRPVDIAARMLRGVLKSDAEPEPIGALSADQLAAIAAAEKVALSPGALAVLARTVTPLVPYYRWEPVPPPAIVPRHPYSQAESVRHLVIRSGAALSAPAEAGGTVEITPPADYAAAMTAAHPELVLDYRATSERHLAPPKGPLEMAELHGMMDGGIGSADPAARRRMLAVALRDDGTLFDREVVDLDDPAVRLPQPGVALAAGPEVPPETLKTLDDLARGDPLAPGQYVLHDTDELVLPYLPDPLAVGVSMVFPDAGKDRGLPPLLAVEGVAARYPGTWPALEPFRLVLESADELAGRVEGRTITIGLPPGTKLRLRLSSTMTRAGLDLLGLWRLLPQAIRDTPILYEAATRGWFWAFTPSEAVTLVHAVPRPLEAPRPTILVPVRTLGATDVRLIGALDCHGPSTDRIDAEASWTEWLDDPAEPGPAIEPRAAVAFSTQLGENEDLVVLAGADGALPVPGYGTLLLHGSKHELGDTKHRNIDYRFRATTRFREYFPPAIMDDLDERSIVGAPRRISVPSSVRPPAPLVHQVLPLFRWDEAGEPAQPFAVRRRRRAGLRVYLERPWYASGEGELVGVVVAPAGQELSVGPHVSQWGSDPVWAQAGPKRRALYLELSDLLHMAGFDDRADAARPVAPPATLPLAEAAGAPVQVLGYRPEYNPERRLWFVDIAIDPGTAVWPFVRLALTRYQPDSLPGCHLSPVVHPVFTQLTPTRTATLSRPDSGLVRLVVSGPLGLRASPGAIRERAGADPAALAAIIGANHRFLMRLERRNPLLPTDLGWQTEAVTELAVVGYDPADGEFAWMGVLALSEPVEPARPGGVADWRVTVEEWEAIEADPEPFVPRGPLTREWRIVYADRLHL